MQGRVLQPLSVCIFSLILWSNFLSVILIIFLMADNFELNQIVKYEKRKHMKNNSNTEITYVLWMHKFLMP